ncbi:MAG TPA: SUMF1/EgtB/PvdO family nonheme iron enzyme [Candidatus Eisenbacteria bacterium]|nr:SUMF1/EgtB/PvdO family nonheme iron enzyme [Candidatus Eisenbacteria bacterium]
MTIPEIVMIPAGFFWMGSASGYENEMPRHRVWLDTFGVAKYPVTNMEYRLFVEETGVRPPPFWRESIFSDPAQPVVGVDWHEACAYCEWLSVRAGAEFRLPTEAEWERAARGNREGALYPWGDEPPWERPYLGYDPNSGGPQTVGSNEANDFGLYDMCEGVHEWCSDFYDARYYHYSPERNPSGPESGTRRVSRGGSWRHRIKFSRCAARSSLPPSFKYADYGFRLALTPG